jgi:uncharacterized membrane protein
MSAAAARAPGKPSVLLRIALIGSIAVALPATAGLLAALVSGQPLPAPFRLAAVNVHIAAVLAAMPLGVVQLVAPKGTFNHRTLGYLWCALLVLAAMSSFAIQLDPEGGVTLIHAISSLFSVATLILIPLVIHFGRTGRAKAHRRALLGIFFFLLLAGILSFLPGRAFGDLIVSLAG